MSYFFFISPLDYSARDDDARLYIILAHRTQRDPTLARLNQLFFPPYHPDVLFIYLFFTSLLHLLLLDAAAARTETHTTYTMYRMIERKRNKNYIMPT